MFRITVVTERRPWWGLGILVKQEWHSLISPPEVTRQEAEALRQEFLTFPKVIGAKLESLDGP